MCVGWGVKSQWFEWAYRDLSPCKDGAIHTHDLYDAYCPSCSRACDHLRGEGDVPHHRNSAVGVLCTSGNPTTGTGRIGAIDIGTATAKLNLEAAYYRGSSCATVRLRRSLAI